ncbi:MAG: HAD-IIIA family hydrolase [Bacteroidota bacterium]
MAGITDHLPWEPQKWTLFTDRDGVLNYLIKGDYIKTWEEFNFIPGAPDAFQKLAPLFKYVFIATNQRGVSRGLMSMSDLDEIHEKMCEEVHAAGGRIDKVYSCINHDEPDPEQCRKPRIGMALQAQREFEGVDLSRSIMLGDNISDMEFGRNAGMYTVFICQDGPPRAHADKIDHHCQGVVAFADWMVELVRGK